MLMGPRIGQPWHREDPRAKFCFDPESLAIAIVNPQGGEPERGFLVFTGRGNPGATVLFYKLRWKRVNGGLFVPESLGSGAIASKALAISPKHRLAYF